MWREENPHTLLVSLQIGTAAVKNELSFLKKLKIELPFNLVIALLGIYPKKTKTTSS